MKKIVLGIVLSFFMVGHNVVLASPKVIENFANFWDRDPPPFLFSCINFVIYVLFLYWITRKPLREFFIQRHQQMRMASVKSQEEFDGAKAKLDSAQQKHRELQLTIDAMRDDMLRQVTRDLRLNREELQSSLERLQKELTAKLEAEIYYAQKELKVFLVNSAVNYAQREILSDADGLKKADSLVMVENYLSKSLANQGKILS